MDKVPKQKTVSVNFTRALFFWISWLLKMGPVGCPEMTVRNYHSTLHNTSEEWRSHMMIWPWFVFTWSSSEWSGLVWCDSALHIWIEGDPIYLSAKFKGKKPHLAFKQIGYNFSYVLYSLLWWGLYLQLLKFQCTRTVCTLHSWAAGSSLYKPRLWLNRLCACKIKDCIIYTVLMTNSILLESVITWRRNLHSWSLSQEIFLWNICS